MDIKLLFVGFSLLSCSTSALADDVLGHVIEYDGTKVNTRTDYTYDSNGLLVQKLVTKPNTEDASLMENYEKVNYGYDDQKRCNLIENYVWDRSSLTFMGRPMEGARTSSVFDDATGRVSEQYFYEWGTSDWEDDYSVKCVYEYDGNNATENRYKRRNGTDQADPYEINDYVYDDNMNVLQKIRNSYSFSFSVGDYAKTPTDKEVYEYDDKGNVTLKETYMYSSGDDYDPWGGGSDPWGDPWGDGSDEGTDEGSESTDTSDEEDNWSLMNRYKYEYEYDEKGNISKKTTLAWRDYLGEYETESVLTYEYFYGSNEALELPYTNNFDADGSFDGMTTAGSGEAGAGWKHEDGAAVCTAAVNGDPDKPEILYLPALRFTTDNEVEITFKAKAADAAAPAKLQMILCSNDDNHTPLGTIGDVWTVSSTDYQEIKGLVVPDKSDAYVIGICFDNNQTGAVVSVDDIEVKNGRPTASPTAPYNFTATPSQDGALEVKLIWYTPNTNLAGDFINHADKMELYRDGVDEPIYTSQATGATLAVQYVDRTIPEKGEYTYRVYAYLDGLKSDAAVVKVKVGYAVPSEIEGLSATENDDHSVTISWNEAKPEDGDVKYYVLRNGSEVLAEDCTGTSFVDNTIDTSNGQQYVYYLVQPYNEVGYGRTMSTTLLFVGQSTPAPFSESFAGGEPEHQWMNEIVSGYDAAWGTGASSPSYPSVEPQDGDGGFAAFLSTTLAEGNEVRFTSEKIDVSKLVDPELTFYMYLVNGEQTADAIVVEASKNNGEYEALTSPIYVSGSDAEGWTKQTVSLDKFKGEKNVRLSFRGISGITHDILIDNISVGEKATSGIGSALADGVKVYAENGTIVVSAPAESDIKVYTADGAQVYAARGAEARVAVAGGLYLVSVDGHSVKVSVR